MFVKPPAISDADKALEITNEIVAEADRQMKSANGLNLTSLGIKIIKILENNGIHALRHGPRCECVLCVN